MKIILFIIGAVQLVGAWSYIEVAQDISGWIAGVSILTGAACTILVGARLDRLK